MGKEVNDDREQLDQNQKEFLEAWNELKAVLFSEVAVPVSSFAAKIILGICAVPLFVVVLPIAGISILANLCLREHEEPFDYIFWPVIVGSWVWRMFGCLISRLKKKAS